MVGLLGYSQLTLLKDISPAVFLSRERQIHFNDLLQNLFYFCLMSEIMVFKRLAPSNSCFQSCLTRDDTN